MKTQAFTLIELIVVITIMVILLMMTYLPYAHHQKKTVLLQGSREISQSLYEARNLAIHGLDTGSGNLSVGLFFPDNATQIEYYAYPFSQTINQANPDSAYLYKTKILPKGVQVDSLGGVTGSSFLNFDAISGSGSVTGTGFVIQISFQGAVDPILQRQILYNPQSYISDY